ncbi:extensin-2-like [Daphnia pulex]|uniref:extensin-2-like n=1 Tax=Daphnia pulex TaxID=6669 RepID=UPI001EE05E2A|nr:extensin-2-like [Daphnia pulex]
MPSPKRLITTPPKHLILFCSQLYYNHTTEAPEYYTTEAPEYYTTEAPEYYTTEAPEYYTTEAPEYYTTEAPEYYTTEAPEYYTTEAPEYYTTEAPEYYTTKTVEYYIVAPKYYSALSYTTTPEELLNRGSQVLHNQGTRVLQYNLRCPQLLHRSFEVFLCPELLLHLRHLNVTPLHTLLQFTTWILLNIRAEISILFMCVRICLSYLNSY